MSDDPTMTRLRKTMLKANSFSSVPNKFGGWSITINFEDQPDAKRLHEILTEAVRMHAV